jgi:hypothetical protein
MCVVNWSRDSSVSTVTGYELESQDSIPSVRDFSPLHSVQAESGAQPVSYQLGTGGFLSGDKTARA